MHEKNSVLFKNGFIHSSSDPFATALYIESGVVAWIGDTENCAHYEAQAERVVDLAGALVAPAFVDSHVHLLETEFALTCIDVSPRAGGRSTETVLSLLRDAADGWTQNDPIIMATGYDDSMWSGSGLTGEHLSSSFPHVPIYVPRADLHSALCTSELLAMAHVEGTQDSHGWLIGRDHTVVRDYIRERNAQDRESLYSSVLSRFAQSGFVAVHENSAPGIDTREGLRTLLSMTADASSKLPLVVGYRGETVTSPEDLAVLFDEIPGLSGLAGDVSVDGSFGSHSAALREEYADAPREFGTLHLSSDVIEQHLRVCSQAGVSAGFHVIGDRALDEVIAAAERLAQDPSMKSAMRRAGHRLEHVELADADTIAKLVEYGFMVSVQPAFDAYWGGSQGMYAARLGEDRARRTTPIREFTRAGVPMGFGSDSPVTAIDPWGSVAAAVFHHERDFRISARAAFKAHTRGGWRIAGENNPLVGEIRVGAPAHLAVWRADQLGVQAENDGRSVWSTDARSGSPLLPILDRDEIAQGSRPTCIATLRDGTFIHDSLMA